MLPRLDNVERNDSWADRNHEGKLSESHVSAPKRLIITALGGGVNDERHQPLF
jgi:hypothetical protein